jgi:hypothetical protein
VISIRGKRAPKLHPRSVHFTRKIASKEGEITDSDVGFESGLQSALLDPKPLVASLNVSDSHTGIEKIIGTPCSVRVSNEHNSTYGAAHRFLSTNGVPIDDLVALPETISNSASLLPARAL